MKKIIFIVAIIFALIYFKVLTVEQLTSGVKTGASFVVNTTKQIIDSTKQ